MVQQTGNTSVLGAEDTVTNTHKKTWFIYVLLQKMENRSMVKNTRYMETSLKKINRVVQWVEGGDI